MRRSKGKKGPGKSKKSQKIQEESEVRTEDSKCVTCKNKIDELAQNVEEMDLSLETAEPKPSTSSQQSHMPSERAGISNVVALTEKVEKLITTVGKNLNKKSLDQEIEAMRKLILEVKSSLQTKAAPQPIVYQKADENIKSKWPRISTKVPTIFLHKPVDFQEHAIKVISTGIHFYQPQLTGNFTKILCQTLNDHASLVKYFEKNHLQHHTYCDPSEKWLRFVIRGLPADINLKMLKSEMKSNSIPIKRAHIMRLNAEQSKQNKSFVLVVVPDKIEAKKLLDVDSIFGCQVRIELPYVKSKQCHRCQKWGHTQQYCRGEVRCVKCAGGHYSNECTRDRKKEPPRCANCDGEHTASYRRCSYCPDSKVHKLTQKKKKELKDGQGNSLRVTPKSLIVTEDNLNNLYVNVDYEIHK